MENGQIRIFWLNLICIKILIEVTRILIDIIILVKIRILVNFIRNIVSTKIPVISIRILYSNKFSQKILICPFSTRNFFQCKKLTESQIEYNIALLGFSLILDKKKN